MKIFIHKRENNRSDNTIICSCNMLAGKFLLSVCRIWHNKTISVNLLRFFTMKGKITIYLLLVSAFLLLFFVMYRSFFGLNVRPGKEPSVIYIPEGSDYSGAMDSVVANLDVKNEKILRFIAEKKKYPSLIKSGRYLVEKEMSYNELINLLRSGRQMPVNITFNNIRTLNDLAGKIGGRIEADSTEIIDFLNNEENYVDDGFSIETIISVFIPDTYELYWNTSARGLYNRMLREYRNFWNEKRLKLAEDENLDPLEVSVLASIVEEEATKADEKPRIAGVYINRLKRGIPLQADPTIKFAVNDFTLSRVLSKHLLVESPYNTYKYKGLPPGPINCPSIESIEAVLNAEKHDYLFFVAKSDFSGYHYFSKTLSEHNRYAAEYRRELNRRRIYR